MVTRLAEVPIPRKAPTQPGSVLRSIRNRQGLTLAEVSRRTGLPLSTLSKVENDKMSLTYDKLVRISEGLQIDIEALFAPNADQPPISVVHGRRSIDRRGAMANVIETEEYNYLYPAADLLNKRFVPIIIEARAREIGEVEEFSRHDGEEYVYVLEGALDMYSELYAVTRLHAGDSIFFDSSMGHAFLAAAGGPCRFLSICSHPDPGCPPAA